MEAVGKEQREREVARYVAAQVSSRLLALGWSQKRLAIASGLDQSTVSRILDGEHSLDLHGLCLIAPALSCDLDDLLPPFRK